MKIVIDVTPLLIRSAGVKGVIYHWSQALLEEAAPGEVRLFPALGKLRPLDHERSVASRPRTALAILQWVLNNKYGLPVTERYAGRGDVFHATNQIWRPPAGPRLTATLHDVTAWKLPDKHHEGTLVLDDNWLRRVLRPAAGLLAVSEHTRRDAVEVLGLDPDKIKTVYNGVAEPYFRVRQEETLAVRNRYGLAKPYVLQVGTIEPRKNTMRLLDAWQSLRWELRDFYDLILIGPMGWADEAVQARIRSLPPGIRYLGYVPESDLPALTKGASLLAYPSLYEGFGLPIAQAMACGVAVLTSNTSSMPEVAGGGARLVDPQSQAEIAAALSDLLENKEERARLGAAGRQIALERYRWPVVARKSLDFFRHLDA